MSVKVGVTQSEQRIKSPVLFMYRWLANPQWEEYISEDSLKDGKKV